MKKISAAERGSVGLMMALAFLALTVPLLTGALGLAGSLSMDSRVKSGILKDHYSVTGAAQHAIYRLVYEPGYADGLEIDSPDVYNLTINGQTTAVTIEKLAAPSDEFPLPPPLGDNSRNLQASKVVTPTTALPLVPTTFTYTITVENKSDDTWHLSKIYDLLPAGFSYLAGSTSGITVIEPSISGQGESQELSWDVANQNIHMLPGQMVELTFQADAQLLDGTYCNEAWVDPGAKNTSSGQTAPVIVGILGSELCQAPAVAVTKQVTPNVVPVDTPIVYTYTITIENIGPVTLNSDLIRDVLPEGFLYVVNSTSGNITSSNPQTGMQNGRQRLDWSFGQKKQFAPGETYTLVFDAQATAPAGEHWNEVWVRLDEIQPPVYTWPTAPVRVMAPFRVTVSNSQATLSASILFDANGYYISEWEIAR